MSASSQHARTFAVIALANALPVAGIVALGWDAVQGLALFCADLFALVMFGALHVAAANLPAGMSTRRIVPLAAFAASALLAVFYMTASALLPPGAMGAALSAPALGLALGLVLAWRFVAFALQMASPERRRAQHAALDPLLPIAAGAAMVWLISPNATVATLLLGVLCALKAGLEMMDARYDTDDSEEGGWALRAMRRFSRGLR